MGVKGLWKLIESAGVPVPLETLENKVLGVDVSIWLHQAVRGFRGPGGAAVANAHLLTLFHRICKLLFYRIRPVFVFDGGVPYLKKQTLASRKLKREVATNKARQVRERLLKNLLKSQAVRRALGKVGPGPSSVHVPQVTKKEKDLFELPPLPEALTEETSVDDMEGKRGVIDDLNLPNLHQFDFEGEDFKNMSLEMKHEILSELQNTRKQNSWASINSMPQQAESFADFQMARLMKRAKFQATLDSTREEIRKSKVSEMEEELFGDLEKYVSLSRRIVSEDASHAVFVKKASTSNSDSKNMNEEPDRKGKSLLKRKKPLDKDFLTELAKVGVIQQNSQRTDSDSGDESDDYHLMHDEGWSDTRLQPSKIEEEESFLQVVGSLMENSGLTQDEILALIQQDQRDGVDVPCVSAMSDGPSTSANAPGRIYNPDADSSDDDDDFIEVTDDPQPTQKEENKIDDSVNNIDKLLGTKNNSLWMKIVQQKLDDMVHVNNLKTSPKKAIVDSRMANKSKPPLEGKAPKEGTLTLKPVQISLNFEAKPLKMEDNIFSDIFIDLVSQPGTKRVPDLRQSNQQSRQDAKTQDSFNIDLNSNPNTSPGAANSKHANINGCSETHVSLPSWSGRSEDVLHDEVELMSSSDESEDEELTSSNTCPPTPTKPNHSPSPSSGEAEHENASVVNSRPHTVTSHIEKESDPTPSTIISENKSRTKIDSIKTVVHGDSKSTESTKSGAPEAVVCKDASLSSTRQAAQSGPSPAVTAVKTTTQITRTSCSIDENSRDSSLASACSTVRDTLKSSSTDAKEDDLKHTGDHQQDSGVTPQLSSLNCKGNLETTKNKDISKENASAVSEVMKETPRNIPDQGDGREAVTLQRVTDSTQDSTDNEVKLQTETDAEQEKEVTSSVEESEMEENDIERPLDYTEDELKHLEGELASEQQVLIAQAQKSERVAASLNDQMYGESQYLLQLFGIPYLVAPMEAEAQCAFLNGAKLTEGTITDDSDIFLFGGDSVYRNFFNQTRQVEHFKVDNVKSTLGLDRSKMITLSLLSGSDYTEGIEGIGSVSAMEILAEFPGEGIECLKNLRKWWNVAHKGVSAVNHSKIKQKLAQVSLPESFPNDSVYEAYLTPEVDESREKFSWAVPNVEALRDFTGEKFGWNHAKADEILLPVMKKLKIKTTQKRIESYFTNIKLMKEPKVSSKRMQEAIAKTKGIKLPDSGHSPGKPRARPTQRKKKVVKDSESETISEESEPTAENDPDPKSLKPRRTLLVDPAEVKSKSPAEGRRGQKRKKDSKEEDEQGQKSKKDPEEAPQRKLTKEDMFRSLLEKETISQREKDQQEMQEKKMAAALILKKQNKEKTKR